MKLTAIFIVLFALQSMAESFAQVTLREKKAPLEKVLQAIKKQSGYDLVYQKEMVRSKGRPVAIQLRNVSLLTALELIFKDQELDFELVGKIITVKERKIKAPLPLVSKPTLLSPFPKKESLIDVKGRVVNEKGEAVIASILVKGDLTKGTTSNEEGYFELKGVEDNAILLISGVGIEMIEVKVEGKTELATIIAKTKISEIDAVLVSTGYQTIPKERTTGSFTVISQEQLSRQVGSTLPERLEGLVPGLYFDRSRLSTPQISLRGINTIRGDQSPLIVLDNFPFEGDLNLINPADIENITILRDAASASIWGARAANGVIVIKTRQGAYNTPVKVQAFTNLSVRNEPNLFYQQQMTVKDYTDWERWLFENGRYASLENSNLRSVLSPVVEVLIAKRDGLISSSDADAAIQQLGARRDIRNDYLDYYYRNELIQRSSVNISGGSAIVRFGISAGLDLTQMNVEKNFMSRRTLAFTSSVKPSNKFEISAGINLADATTNIKTKPFFSGQPYETWTNTDGSPAIVGRNYRHPFKEESETKGLLDWQYRPLNEIGLANQRRRDRSLIINLAAKWDILKGLSLESRFQSQEQISSEKDQLNAGSYEVRNLVNSYSQVNAATGAITRPIPEGDIVDFTENNIVTRSGRVQLNYQTMWKEKHQLYLTGGTEVRLSKSSGKDNRIYGFNEEGLTIIPIDYITRFPQYFNRSQTATLTIPYRDQVRSGANNFVSYFANGAYTFRSKYTISVSTRQDATNFFGTSANQRWQPLWSTGFKWQLSKETFFKVPWLSKLDLRVTYGYNGSTGGGTALATGQMSTDPRTFLQAARITNPPNPSLKWEKTRIVNIGVDFSATNNRIKGSLEFYSKMGQDLIGPSPLDPTTGFFTGTFTTIRNYASTLSNGVDIELYTNNINGSFEWNTALLFSFNRSKVKEYFGTLSTNSYLTQSIIPGYIPGYLFAYQFVGLDPNTGNPIGLLDGKESTNYASIRSSTKPEELVRIGSPVAPFFGTLSNTFSWKKLSFEILLAYRFGHYFKRETFTYGVNSNHSDYSLRWKKPGDELITNIPSVTTDFNNLSNKILFYTNSSILFDRADNVRLQMVNLSYQLNKIQLSLNAANLGILWKATKHQLDPDIAASSIPIRPTFSVNCSFKL